jgi:hypothetical protein
MDDPTRCTNTDCYCNCTDTNHIDYTDGCHVFSRYELPNCPEYVPEGTVTLTAPAPPVQKPRRPPTDQDAIERPRRPCWVWNYPGEEQQPAQLLAVRFNHVDYPFAVLPVHKDMVIMVYRFCEIETD